MTQSFSVYLSLLHILSHFVTSSEPVVFSFKFDFAKMLTFLMLNEQVFQKKVTNSENSPPKKSSDQDSSYLMDAQPVFVEINDSSEYINPEIHLVALKN